MAPNAAMSCTARSARALRSISMPAVVRPSMKRLYDRPNPRAAALMRWIHSAR
jgi:hypothetical protein